MALYNRDSILAEAIMSHPSLIPVVTRLGIRLGIGDATIGTICAQRGVDPDFFLAVINTFVDEDYFPADARGLFPIQLTIDYLRKTNLYFSNVQLPNIERHFAMLQQRSGNDNNIGMLRRFYSEMKGQLSDCLTRENDNLFPMILAGDPVKESDLLTKPYEEVEARLHDLLLFFVEHLHGDYDSNLCTAVVSAVFSLDKDVCQNNRIRNRILVPLIKEM